MKLHDAIRPMGIHLCSGKGTGKSRLEAYIAWNDFIRNIPVIVIDPMGVTISHFFMRLAHQPPQVQRQLSQRVRYLDLAGTDEYAFPFPLYSKTGIGKESLATVSEHFLHMCRRLDP